MPSPFKSPKIEYKPQVADDPVLEPLPSGEEGERQSAADVAEVIGKLIEEIREAVSTIEGSLSSFAISDKDGVLSSAAASILNTEQVPSSVSYSMYSVMKNSQDAGAVTQVFEDKAYSVWGNASVALVDALGLIAREAIKSKSFLEEGVASEKIVESIEKWVGEARSFVVDAEIAGTAVPSEDLINEIEFYAADAIDVQKSAIISANKTTFDVKSNLASLKNLYESGNVYDSIVDISPTVESRTSGVVATIIDTHADISSGIQDSLIDDLDYRTESFTEVSNNLLASVSHLRVTQMVNTGLGQFGGISEESIDDVVSANPDRSFDDIMIAETRESESIDPKDSITLSRIMATVNGLTSLPGVEVWHMKSIHDALLIDAASLEGLTADQIMKKVALIKCVDDQTSLFTAEGIGSMVIPELMAGYKVTAVGAHVFSPSSSGDVLFNVRLNNLTISSHVLQEGASDTSGQAAATISDHSLSAGDVLYIDTESIGTGSAGLEVRVEFSR